MRNDYFFMFGINGIYRAVNNVEEQNGRYIQRINLFERCKKLKNPLIFNNLLDLFDFISVIVNNCLVIPLALSKSQYSQSHLL